MIEMKVLDQGDVESGMFPPLIAKAGALSNGRSGSGIGRQGTSSDPCGTVHQFRGSERPLLVIVETFYHCCPIAMGKCLAIPMLSPSFRLLFKAFCLCTLTQMPGFGETGEPRQK